MIVRLEPHPDQIRFFAESALSGFQTLAPVDAIANAKDDLTSLLAYLTGLSRADHAVPVTGIETIEARRHLDGATHRHPIVDLVGRAQSAFEPRIQPLRQVAVRCFRIETPARVTRRGGRRAGA